MDASFCQPRQSGASLLIVTLEIILTGNTRKLFLFPCHEQPTAGSLGRRFVSQKHISDELASAVLCAEVLAHSTSIRNKLRDRYNHTKSFYYLLHKP